MDMEDQNNINDDVLYPGNITRKAVISYNKEIIEQLRTHAFTTCQNMINQDYINDLLEQITPFSNSRFNIYTYYNLSNELLGFVIFKLKINKYREQENINYKEVYISLICARMNNYKLGTIILNDVEKYCFNKDVYKISLDAIKTAIPFYIKKGFKLVGENSSQMIKRLEGPITVNMSRKKTRRARRANRTYKKFAENLIDWDL